MSDLWPFLSGHDPELTDHLECLQLDLSMIIPSAWLSVFAKWLPLDTLLEVVPFLAREGLVGFLAVTFIIILSHRLKLLESESLDELLSYVQRLSSHPPDNIIAQCE